MRIEVRCANVFCIVAISSIVAASLVAQDLAPPRQNRLTQKPESTEQEIPEAYQANPDDVEEMRVKKEIVRAMQSEVEEKLGRVRKGQDPVFPMLEARLRLRDAQAAVHVGNKEQLVKIALDALNDALEIEENRKLRYMNGIGLPDEAYQATAVRLQCELNLLQTDRSAYMKYKGDTKKLSDYCNRMFETAKQSKVFSNLGKYSIQGPFVTMKPGEDFELQTRVLVHGDSGQRKLGHIFLKAMFDGSEYQTQEFYWEFEGKRTNLADDNQ